MKWVSVKDGLPNDGEKVLVHDARYGNSMAMFMEEPGQKPAYSFSLTDGTYVDDQNITHWLRIEDPA